MLASELQPDLSTVTSLTKTWYRSVMLINLGGATFPQNRLSALLPSGQLVTAGALQDRNTAHYTLLFSSLLISSLFSVSFLSPSLLISIFFHFFSSPLSCHLSLLISSLLP